MKAAIYYGPGDIRVEEMDMPHAGDMGIVVRVRSAGVCGTDVHAYKTSRTGYATGKIMGHEFSGDVVEIGPKVTDISLGDRVWTIPMLPCFECPVCLKGNYFRCPNTKAGGISGADGGFAEYAWVPVTALNGNVIKLNDDTGYQDGAIIEPVGVGVLAANRAEALASDTVVLIGAGLVGLGAVAALKDRGVASIIASDVSEKRLAAAKAIGADVLIRADAEDAVETVLQATDGRGADVVIEAAGIPATFQQSIDMVRRDGKVMVVATYDGPFEFDPSLTRPGLRMSSLVRKSVRMIGCYGGDSLGAYQLISNGIITADQVVTHTFPLDEVERAFGVQMDTVESIKVMLAP